MTKLPLRTLLIAPFLVQVLSITGLVGYFSYRSGQRTAEDVARQLMTETSYRVSADLEEFLQVPRMLAQVNAHLLRTSDAINFSHLEGHFLEQVRLFPQITGVVITDTAGTFLNVARLDQQSAIIRRRNITTQDDVLYRYYSDLTGHNLTLIDTQTNYDPHQHPPDDPWYGQAQQSPEAFWRLVVTVHQGQDTPLMALARFQPVYGVSGDFRGVASTGILLPELGHFLQNLMADQPGQVMIIESNGRLVATSTGELPVEVVGTQALEQPRTLEPQWRSWRESSDPLTQAIAVHVDADLTQAGPLQAPLVSEFQTETGRYFVKATPVGGELDWLLVTAIPSHEFMATVQDNLARTILLCGLALLGSIGLGLWTAETLAKPILSLQQATQAFTEGWSTIPPTQPSRIHEVESLRQKFDQMVAQLVASFRILRDRENTLATFLNGVPVAISVHDATGRMLFLNEKGRDILTSGILDSPLERLSQDYSLYRAGTDQLYPTDQLPMAKGLRGETAITHDIEVVRADRRIPIEVNTIPIFGNRGQVLYCINTFQDVTERRQTEALRANYERELEQRVTQQMASLAKGEITKQALINAIPDLLMRLSRDGQPLEIYNIDAVHWMGDKSKAHQLPMYEGLLPEIASARKQCIENALATGQVQRHEYEFTVDGQPICEEARVVPVTQDEVLVVVRDISDRRKIDRMKDEFIAIVSHELRTPLTAIRGALGILNTGVLNDRPEKAQHLLHMSLANTERLIRLVNDILDLERLTSGKVTLVKEACAVADLMQMAIDGVEALALEAHVTICCRPIQATLWASPDAVVQTLTNLLSNAIKFSPTGSTVYLAAEVVTSKTFNPFTNTDITTAKAADTPTEALTETLSVAPAPPIPQANTPTPPLPYVLFSLADQGRGIPVDRLDTIFDRFQQVDVSDSRQWGGTGLGLTICKNLVEQHGGTIWAESVLGEGSTFYFTLPLHPYA